MFKIFKENQTANKKEPLKDFNLYADNRYNYSDFLSLDLFTDLRKANCVNIFFTSSLIFNISNIFFNKIVLNEIKSSLINKADISFKYNYLTAEGKCIGFIYLFRQLIITKLTNGDYYRYKERCSILVNFFNEFLNGFLLGMIFTRSITSDAVYRYYSYDNDFKSTISFKKFMNSNSIRPKIYFDGSVYQGLYRGFHWSIYFTLKKIFQFKERSIYNDITLSYIASEIANLLRLPFYFYAQYSIFEIDQVDFYKRSNQNQFQKPLNILKTHFKYYLKNPFSKLPGALTLGILDYMYYL